MENIYLNELSVDGQFQDIEEFSDAILPVMKCLKYIKNQGGVVYKYSEFYNRKITKDKTWNDLRTIRGDHFTRLKSLLLGTTDTPPFWDRQDKWKQDIDAKYQLDDMDVAMTTIAEAAEANGVLLSFPMEKYQNKILHVTKNDAMYLQIPSAVSFDFFVESLREKKQIDIHEYVHKKYEGTRLNFSKIEKQYGFYDFEKEEVEDCLRTFDKFVKIENWNAVYRDKSLRYKKYSPSSKENDWFSDDLYKGNIIDKFRCGNKKRCFGYREDNIFYVLRMERDHKISDKG